MYLKISFYFAALFLIISLGACQEKQIKSTSLVSINPSSVPPECRDSTIIGGRVTYRIKSECAITYINDYQDFTDEVIDSLETNYPSTFSNPAQDLIYGAQIDLIELREILLRAETGEGNKLYAMMGIMPNESAAMIFALQHADQTMDFFDFTLPCPNACPPLSISQN